VASVRASGVPYADFINEAASKFGVSPALLQGMLDIDDRFTFDLPEPAVQYALDLARSELGGAAQQVSDASLQPRANILAAAWFLSNVLEMRGSEMDAISYFYGNTPRSRIKAARIVSGPYERRRRQWA
jgi:soluble lytic murein transglycosylase-like protein